LPWNPTRTSTAPIYPKRRSAACSFGSSTCRTAIRPPGRSLTYKLRWVERLAVLTAATPSQASNAPVVLAGRLQRPAHELDGLTSRKRWLDRCPFFPPRSPLPALSPGADQTIALDPTGLRSRFHPGAQIFTFWDYFRKPYFSNAGLRIRPLPRHPANRRPRLPAPAWIAKVRALGRR